MWWPMAKPISQNEGSRSMSGRSMTATNAHNTVFSLVRAEFVQRLHELMPHTNHSRSLARDSDIFPDSHPIRPGHSVGRPYTTLRNFWRKIFVFTLGMLP